jgi:hypothetical protein
MLLNSHTQEMEDTKIFHGEFLLKCSDDATMRSCLEAAGQFHPRSSKYALSVSW